MAVARRSSARFEQASAAPYRLLCGTEACVNDETDDQDQDHRGVQPWVVAKGALVVQVTADGGLLPTAAPMSSPAMRLRHENAQPCFNPPTMAGREAGRTTSIQSSKPFAPRTLPARRSTVGTWSLWVTKRTEKRRSSPEPQPTGVGIRPPRRWRKRSARRRTTVSGVRSRVPGYLRHVDVQQVKAERFLALHEAATPLLLPNPWDVGSAKLLASLGFDALATTSGGFAASLGRLDGSVTRDEALAHAQSIVGATDLPVSADLENGFSDDPAGVAETVVMAIGTGLAGCSVEDYTGQPDAPIYDLDIAVQRVAAAARSAHGGAARFVITARAENYLHGRRDLADTIGRLQAYEEAGADVLYAPGVTRLKDVRELVAAVGRPVNFLALPGSPSVSALAAVGVRRISVGSAFAYAALGALVQAAHELREEGTYEFWAGALTGASAARVAFAADDERHDS